MKHILFLLMVLFASVGFSQTETSHFRKGNDLFNSGKFTDAEIEYRKGLAKKQDSWTGKFNLADALYKQNKYKEASVILDSLSKSTKNNKQLSSVYHNMGNAQLKNKEYEQSVESFKKALKLDPKAEDSRYNLSYALQKLKQEKQQQQQQQQKQDKKQDQKQDQKQNQEKQKDQKQEEQKKQNLNREEAERMLDALNRDEKELRKKTEKKVSKNGQAGSGKDW
jgi:Ca-activated chloride channel family protein